MKRTTVFVTLLTVACLLCAAPAMADTVWTGLGGDNSFSTALNWDNGAPTSAHYAVFNDPTTAPRQPSGSAATVNMMGLDFNYAGWTASLSGNIKFYGTDGMSLVTGSGTATGTVTLAGSTFKIQPQIAQDWTVSAGNTLDLNLPYFSSAGTWAITKKGAGTLMFSGAASAATSGGPFTVDDGTLVLARTVKTLNSTLAINTGAVVDFRSNSDQVGGAITLNSGGTIAIAAGYTLIETFTFNNGGILAGTGTFGTVNLNDASKHIAPGYGNTPGSLSFANLTLGAGVYDWDLSSTASDTIVAAALTTDSSTTITVKLNKIGSVTPSGDYTLLTWIGADPTSVGNWGIDFGDTGWTVGSITVVGLGDSANGGSIVLTGLSVPEPATMAFLALGGIGLIGGAIRRRRMT